MKKLSIYLVRIHKPVATLPYYLKLIFTDFPLLSVYAIPYKKHKTIFSIVRLVALQGCEIKHQSYFAQEMHSLQPLPGGVCVKIIKIYLPIFKTK